MQMLTKIGRSAAAALCAGGLAVAMPEAAAAAPATRCLSGVYRVHVRCHYTPFAKLYTAERAWIPFPLSTCDSTPRPL
ncbi:hypothetical protein M8542_27950 [Amycolatopsis sp. OK19-0408]|uniref:Secreted protein n=1 Tax=Amycolatopsis iheyensis TaxID=2945988 RepID=A0A9X2SLF9_9PSEU|nr:hypothetical protein [Amycolatopsis iheyensis]MCR6486667.1 hypothetical protein [Amycolatopsis iheyensis]